MWISGGVLIVGVIVFLSTVVFGESSGLHSKISTQPAQHVKQPVKAAPDPEAYKVARKFISTAVLRKNLDQAYPLVNRDIKGGLSRKQWDTGNIPVIPYPAGNVKSAGFTVINSYKTQMTLVVDLVAAKGTKVRPHLPFFIGLVRAGGKPKGRWLVNYWEADYTPPVQCGPNC
jgi:hypothetical protein